MWRVWLWPTGEEPSQWTVAVVLKDTFKGASVLQYSLRYSELWLPSPRVPLNLEEGAYFHNLGRYLPQISEVMGAVPWGTLVPGVFLPDTD